MPKYKVGKPTRSTVQLIEIERSKAYQSVGKKISIFAAHGRLVAPILCSPTHSIARVEIA